jgi:hypothetical protein
VLADEGEQVAVPIGVLVLGRVRLYGEDADRPALGLQRNVEPGGVLCVGALRLDLALLDQDQVALVRDQLRLAGAMSCAALASSAIRYRAS